MKIETYKIKSGSRFRVRMTLPSGHRQGRSFSTREAAKTFLAKAQLDSRYVAQSKITFREFWNIFLDQYAVNELQPASIEKYRGLVKHYLDPYFGECLLDSITPHLCQSFAATINRRADLSQNQKAYVIGRFKTLLNKAVKFDYLQKNPALALKTPNRLLKRAEFWMPSEVNRFFAFASQTRSFPLYMIAFNSGMRVGELFALKWDMVDLESGQITVMRSWDQKTASVKNTTKSHKTRNFIASQALLNFLRELKLKSGESEFVINRVEIGCSCPSHASRMFREDAKRAGIKSIRFHGIRHTFATEFVRNGGDLFKLAKILGHSSTAVTDRYAHFAIDIAGRVSELVSFKPNNESKVLSFGHEMVMASSTILQSG